MVAMTPIPDRAAARLAWTRHVLDDASLTLEPASADASFRSYWRTRHAGDSWVVMDSPPAQEDPRPWLEIGARLSAAGLHVPAVQAHDLAQGFLLIEDLGSRLYLPALNDNTVDALYDDAMDALLRMQRDVDTARMQPYDHAFLQRELPGCERGRLLNFGTQVGIRETRRVAGDHVLTAEELLRPEPFADAIAAGAYPIDIHPAAGGGLSYRSLGEEHAYRIPLRSLIPRGLDNALVAGRGISATHEALAAVRVMTICMAMGQAAGTAAAMAVRADGGADLRAIDVQALRRQLMAEGACLA